MSYHSPLGYNFKLEASISAAKELQEKKTSDNDDFGANSSGLNKSCRFERRNSGSTYSNSTGWQKQNWKSPNLRHSFQNESVNISLYYHPSMLEDPWKKLEDGENSTL